ncbi:MAG: hypothetical protein J3Q66DRAFT_376146 [Benniella sp.]|nr:MAG: hypothetical protein J3Q66DRAFT_376146 [Benniella sp.]
MRLSPSHRLRSLTRKAEPPSLSTHIHQVLGDNIQAVTWPKIRSGPHFMRSKAPHSSLMGRKGCEQSENPFRRGAGKHVKGIYTKKDKASQNHRAATAHRKKQPALSLQDVASKVKRDLTDQPSALRLCPSQLIQGLSGKAASPRKPLISSVKEARTKWNNPFGTSSLGLSGKTAPPRNPTIEP